MSQGFQEHDDPMEGIEEESIFVQVAGGQGQQMSQLPPCPNQSQQQYQLFQQQPGSRLTLAPELDVASIQVLDNEQELAQNSVQQFLTKCEDFQDPVKLKVTERGGGGGGNAFMTGFPPFQQFPVEGTWIPPPPQQPPQYSTRRRNHPPHYPRPSQFANRVSSGNQHPYLERANRAQMQTQQQTHTHTPAEFIGSSSWEMDLLDSPRVQGVRSGLRRYASGSGALNVKETLRNLNSQTEQMGMWGLQNGDFRNRGMNGVVEASGLQPPSVDQNPLRRSRGGMQQPPRLNPPNPPQPLPRCSFGPPIQRGRSGRTNVVRTADVSTWRDLSQDQRQTIQSSTNQVSPEDLNTVNLQDMCDTNMYLLDDFLFRQQPQQQHLEGWTNGGNRRQGQQQLQQLQQQEYMDEHQYFFHSGSGGRPRGSGMTDGGASPSDFAGIQSLYSRFEHLTNRHRVHSQVGERLSQVMDQINMMRVQMDGSDTRPQSRQRLLNMLTQAMEDYGGPPEFGLPVNSGEMREMVRRARQAGISPDLLFSDRDFNANDYEQLLRLDQFAEHAHLGATSDQIQSIQLITVDPDGYLEGERCAICLEDFVIGDVLRRMPCGHCFHKKCLDQWLAHKAVCPNCGKDFREGVDNKGEYDKKSSAKEVVELL